jgi:hypothetical protein
VGAVVEGVEEEVGEAVAREVRCLTNKEEEAQKLNGKRKGKRREGG